MRSTMEQAQQKRIVLGITGGIAAYKAAELARLLVKQGIAVQVVMTEAATHFITPATMQALTGQPVLLDQWQDDKGMGGLKVYGKDEWHQEKHDVAARRTWRKLHIAVDENHQIIACDLTTPEVGDTTAVPDLLDQISTPFDTFMADGAYDGDPVSDAVLDKQPAARIVIPPHKIGICSATGDSQRDGHIRTIKQQGRIAWQKKTNYGLRSYVELAIQRYKRIFGNTLKARALLQQKTEAWIAASALNRMTNLGMPVSVKI